MRWALLALTVLAAALTLDAGLAGDAAAAGVSATAITTGGGHNCALLGDRTVKCWGANDFGQLGDGTTVRRLTPVPVHGLSNVISVSAGSGYTCAVVDSGDGTGPVDCWGADNRSIDDPPNALSLLPAPMGGITNAISVSAGGGIACALLADHTVTCWGENTRGQLGTGTRDASATPVLVPGLAGVQSVDAGDNDVCAVMQADGTVPCWGWSGRLGPVDQAGDALVPTAVPGITGATEVHADPFNSCVLLPGGTPECWGLAFSTRPRPVKVPTGHVKAYRWGKDGEQTDHTCALLAGGTVRCQSPNPYMGQIGNGTTKPNGDRFVTVSGLRDAVAISVAGFYTCALRSSGGVACWGMNTDGQLGDGTRTTRTRPVAVKGLGAAVRSQAAPVAPVFGKSTTLQAVSGSVRVRLPGAKRFVPLSAATTVPVGATIDATGGRVRLTTAKDASGQVQSGLFDSGVFRVAQQLVSASAADGPQVGLTVLTLAGPLPACGAGRASLMASAARRRRHGKSRRLWGDAKGRYRTVGKFAAATVLGTRWLTQDQCGATAVQVARGAVRVDDFVTHKSVLVKAPHRYVAGARGGTGSCGDSISAGPRTSCAFARAVKRAWDQHPRSIERVRSPTTRRTYAMRCQPGLGTVRCIGPHSLFVAFPNCAVVGTGVECTGGANVSGLGVAVRSQAAPVAPVFGKSTTLQAVSGSVRVRLPGAKRFVPLSAATTVPVGATIDATGGRVRLTTAKDASGQVQSGLFDSGVFRVAQQLVSASAADGSQVGLTVLTLAGPLPACGAGRASLMASAARRRRHGKSRRLWGDAKGRYRTVGKFAAATVLGTRWLTQDQCGATAVQVARGAVRVDDFVTHKSVLVKAPHRYVAGTQATAGACSRATANRVLEAHGYPREIGLQVTAGVLCGHFVGAGSTAMVATIAHGACWPFVGWVVLAYESGRWHLVSRGDGQLFIDLPVAVGDGFRETQWMFRKTDTGCNPTAGKRTRVWRWDARRRHLVASAWKTTLAPLNPAEFQAEFAQGEVGCGAAENDQLVCFGAQHVPAGDFPRQVAILHSDGQVGFCTEKSGDSHCFSGDLGAPLPTLSFRERSTIGPYTCTVVETGVQCIVTATGKGFLITPTAMTPVGG